MACFLIWNLGRDVTALMVPSFRAVWGQLAFNCGQPNHWEPEQAADCRYLKIEAKWNSVPCPQPVDRHKPKRTRTRGKEASLALQSLQRNPNLKKLSLHLQTSLFLQIRILPVYFALMQGTRYSSVINQLKMFFIEIHNSVELCFE